MAKSDINSEDKLVQATFAEHLEKVLGWESAFAFNTETFGPEGTPPFDAQEIELAASRIYQHLWTIGKDDSRPGQAA